jgi:hypothetical protein
MNSVIAAALASAFFCATSAQASIITDNFSFLDNTNSAIATGSFSYASSASGTIGYSDLSAFSINVLGQSYDLTFVNTLVGDPNSYVYFGYDTVSHQFVPASIDGYSSPFSGIMAATNGFNGFAFSPLPGQDDPAGTGADGQVTAYSDPAVSANAISLTQVSSVPESSTWAMMMLGFVLLGFFSYRRRAGTLRLQAQSISS